MIREIAMPQAIRGMGTHEHRDADPDPRYWYAVITEDWGK